jgi:hypothetical protein
MVGSIASVCATRGWWHCMYSKEQSGGPTTYPHHIHILSLAVRTLRSLVIQCLTGAELVLTIEVLELGQTKTNRQVTSSTFKHLSLALDRDPLVPDGLATALELRSL